MSDFISQLKDWVWIIGAAVGAALWMGRLEARGKQNKLDIERETKDRIESLTRLEEKLGRERDEDRADRERTYHSIEQIQTDIKELLQRTSK